MPKKLAAFGEVMMRLQVPGYETLAQADTLKYSFSGSGVNVVSALSRYGHMAALITRLPDTPLGAAAATYLRKLGIATDRIASGGKYLGMYFLENGFGVRASRVTYTNRLESSFNTAPEEAYDFEQIASGLEAVHFCGITLAMNDSVRAQMKAFAKQVKQQGGKVIFDCNYRPSLWGEDGYAKARPHMEDMLHLADIVLMNEKDALFTLGMSTQHHEREQQLKELMPLVARKYNIAAIAGTHREINGDNTHSLRGFLYKNGRWAFSERLTFSVYDRIGAGDAFASGIIHGELEEFAPERTVRFAAVAGMLAHTVPGDTPMATEAEIVRTMEQTSAGDVER